MTVAIEQLDNLMERASQALAGIEYLSCEALCLEALGLARESGRYGYYARILLPLQEARRQRRMIAAAGEVQLGSGEAGFDPHVWLDAHEAGCIVLTHPHSAEDAAALDHRARERQQCVEVLFADNPAGAGEWTLRSYAGAAVSCTIAAPKDDTVKTPWFIAATEKLGDAALADVDDTLTGVARVEALERHLAAFPDHEILHQRLAEAARAVRG